MSSRTTQRGQAGSPFRRNHEEFPRTPPFGSLAAQIKETEEPIPSCKRKFPSPTTTMQLQKHAIQDFTHRVPLSGPKDTYTLRKMEFRSYINRGYSPIQAWNQVGRLLYLDLVSEFLPEVSTLSHLQHSGETVNYDTNNFSSNHLLVPSSSSSSFSSSSSSTFLPISQIGRAVQQECRDRSRMPSSA
eukprot:TRINITY_DN3788_c0_g1_i4.p1 TRINITY_DN3788_c0_g1~~TRINITY_DN3788_c0_g1_i4.p1  ORF type:complete len:187 (-),score=8.87 TRINITY_DN3788_c0_g1_i4:12-572(-)